MQCFLCEETGGKLIPFTPAKFKKISHIIEFRKEKEYKYGNIELQKDSAYHVQCYQKVAALKKKIKEQFLLMFPDDQNVSIIIHFYYTSSLIRDSHVFFVYSSCAIFVSHFT